MRGVDQTLVVGAGAAGLAVAAELGEVVGEVVGFEGPDVLLAENRRVTVDDVIAATGFGTGLEASHHMVASNENAA